MTTLIILILCASSYGLPTGNPSNGNDLKSSESASDSREISLEDSATNSKTPVDEFLDSVPDLYKSHFVREQGGKKVAFQPGITKCIKALKWLQEAYFHNISTVSTFIKYNMDSCSNERESKTFCAKNGHGRIRSFKNRCRQCAKGCKDVLNGGTRFTSVNQDFCREADKACKACENNSTCVYKESGYKCNCLAGFQGINCTEDINECANVSCQNGATCIDKVNAYECNCVTGFRGTLCEEDINECAYVTCHNGATCIDKVNGYECKCVRGFRGTLCEEAN